MAKNVKVEILAQDKTARAFKSLKSRMAGVRKSVGDTVKKVAKIGAAFAGAALGATAALVKMRMAAIDNLAKTADKLGVTTEALAGMRHAADLSGVSVSTLDKSLQNMSVQVSNAANGTGIAQKALEDLNLNALALSKIPVDQQMLEVAKAMESVESHTDKVRIAYELFGARGVGVLNMLKGGAGGLEQMAHEADVLGISLNRVDAAKVEDANDQITRAQGVFSGFGNQLSVELSPLISELAANFYQTALDTQAAGDVGQRVAGALVKAFGFVGDAILGLKLVVKGFQAAFAFLMSKIFLGYEKLFLLFDPLIEKYNAVARFFGQGTIENKAAKMMGGLSDAFMTQFDVITDEIKTALDEPLPSQRFKEFYDDVQARARATAEIVAANSAAAVLQNQAPQEVKKLSLVDKAKLEGAKDLAKFEKKTAEEKTMFVMQQMDSELAGVAKHSKKMFALQKAMQIGQAVMNTYTAATKALAAYPPPLNAVFAGLAIASGMAQVAQIRAQSFEGGGFTGRGARAGGLDGKGGYMAMVHPNESITDHTKSGASGINIVNNIDASGGGADVDQRIRAAVTAAGQQTVASVQDLLRRRRLV